MSIKKFLNKELDNKHVALIFAISLLVSILITVALKADGEGIQGDDGSPKFAYSSFNQMV